MHNLTTQQLAFAILFSFFFIYHKIQITIKQESYTKANESGEEAQKETTRLIDIGLPQSKKIKSTVTVRSGSKETEYNEVKYKSTNYIDRVDKLQITNRTSLELNVDTNREHYTTTG